MLQFILSLADEDDRDKVEMLYNKYHDYFMKCAVTKFKSLGRSNCFYDAEDAVQNTFAKISEYFHNIDFSRGEKDVKNYCLSILNNEICNILKENQEIYESSEEFLEKERIEKTFTQYKFVNKVGETLCFEQRPLTLSDYYIDSESGYSQIKEIDDYEVSLKSHQSINKIRF